MSEPGTAADSRPWTGDEPTFDLRPVSASYGKDDPETSALGEAVTQTLHTDSEGTERIRVVPVHRRPDLLAPCADLINSEWQRSQGARLHFLQKSRPEFPTSLILLQGHKETERLLGHVRLSQVVGHRSSLFVESVVVSKTERGKGYGRVLMNETERYARGRGFRRLCLTTHDKQHFYAHLGYVLSTPVQNAGAMATFVPMETLLKFSRMPSQDTSTRTRTPEMDAQLPQGGTDSGGAAAAGSPQPCSLPPPPPPPPPPISTSTLPPPPPPPSIPTPAPPRSPAGPAVVQTLTDTPHRDAKGLPIFWMHKDI